MKNSTHRSGHIGKSELKKIQRKAELKESAPNTAKDIKKYESDAAPRKMFIQGSRITYMHFIRKKPPKNN